MQSFQPLRYAHEPGGTVMRRRESLGLCSLALWHGRSRSGAAARQCPKHRRAHNTCWKADPEAKAWVGGFLRGLEKRGWEVRNLRIDYRFADAGAQAQVFAKGSLHCSHTVIFAIPTRLSPRCSVRARENENQSCLLLCRRPDWLGLHCKPTAREANITGVMQYEPSVAGKWMAIAQGDCAAPHACRFHDQPQDRDIL